MTDGSATHNPPAAATHMTREGLLAQLTKLLPAQFEEVLFRAKLPPEYLSASSTPQATRAIEVLRYLEQLNRLPELVRAIEYVITEQRSPRIRDTHRARAMAPLVVAAATGAAALALLAVMLSSAEMLVRVGLTGHVWYVLLLLLGLFAAVTVFSLFKSYARYSDRWNHTQIVLTADRHLRGAGSARALGTGSSTVSLPGQNRSMRAV